MYIWCDFCKKIKNKRLGDVSPIQVIKNKNISPDNYNRITDADLKYPIIITKNYKVIDGMHRLAEAYLKKKKYIRAYVIDTNTMKKFMITEEKRNSWKPSDWNYYESLTKKDIEKIYKDRFL